MSIVNQLVRTTVRLVSQTHGDETVTGTGFFFSFHTPDPKRLCHTIITNKHVVDDCKMLSFYCSFADEKGNRIEREPELLKIPYPEDIVISHPNDDVDLVAILFSPIYNSVLKSSGNKIHFKSLSSDNLLSNERASELGPLHSVLMIGYPTGLWDKVNNHPLCRRGITATPFCSSLNGRNEFLIDCACYPGSSGSPVFAFEEMFTTRKDGGYTIGDSENSLAGILYAGPLMQTEGTIEVREQQLARIPIAKLGSGPINFMDSLTA